jgi:cellulose synthase/poly-beta-1,6-N-acetylglucosamine synthase-like glycosyltransferase
MSTSATKKTDYTNVDMLRNVMDTLGQLDVQPHYVYAANQTSADTPTHELAAHVESILKNTRKLVYSNVEPAPFYEQRKMLALLIAAHDEELVLANTIRSAIDAGCPAEDIYVVDDNSSDDTSNVARAILPAENVRRVKRSGKGLALTKGAKHFKLAKRYQWIHIADADGAFCPDYFHIFRRTLNKDHAAATGYVRSLPGKNVSQYRAFEYTVGMEIHRRFQDIFGVIPVIPGPTSCFRTDVFEKLDFANGSLTEDFDVTLQIHRLSLGSIQYIPQAIAYTQDPANLKGYVRQVSRWNRGTLQGMLKYRIGGRLTKIDAYLSYQVMLNLLVLVNYLIWLPVIAMRHDAAMALALTLIFDVLLTLMITFLVSMRLKRWDVLAAFPHIYTYKWVSLGVFFKAFTEVIILRKYRSEKGIWDNTRYALPTST